MFEELEGLFVHMVGNALHVRPAQLKINHKETAAGDEVASIIDGVIAPIATDAVSLALSAAIPASVVAALDTVGSSLAGFAPDDAPALPNPNM